MGFKQTLKVIISTIIVIILIAMLGYAFIYKNQLSQKFKQITEKVLGKSKQEKITQLPIAKEPEKTIITGPSGQTEPVNSQVPSGNIQEKELPVQKTRDPATLKREQLKNEYKFLEEHLPPAQVERSKPKKIANTNPEGSTKTTVPTTIRTPKKVSHKKKTSKKRKSTKKHRKNRKLSKLERRVIRLEKQMGIQSSRKTPLHKRVYRLEKLMMERGYK